MIAEGTVIVIENGRTARGTGTETGTETGIVTET